MHDSSLFLGYPLSESYLSQLENLPSPLIEAFIQNQRSEYLQKIEHDGVFYLGKCLESPFDLKDADSLQANLLSLLKKLVPDYPYDQNPIVLIALPPAAT